MHILINKISWNITLDDRTHLLIFAPFTEEDNPPRPTLLSLLIRSLVVEL